MAVRHIGLPNSDVFIYNFLFLVLSCGTHTPFRTQIRRCAVSGFSYRSDYLYYFSAILMSLKYMITSRLYRELQWDNDAVSPAKPCSSVK